ncbi:MAG: hypothetical protein PHE50_00250 [Dehalococcoidales bacterium]|nr:hypothetical protein [Dehalococcoidales bacterium]
MKICFLDKSTKLETVDDLETKARGGMVTSLFKISDYLASCGHHVVVNSDIKKSGTTRSGVVWCGDANEDYDFLICNRGVGSGHSDIKSRHRILWTHDLPHSGFIPEPKTIKAFSATVFMSNYAERIWRYFYKEIGRSFLIPNGVDKEIFYPREKDLNYLIFASAPNRGLKRLPFIFDCIKTRVKRPVYMKAFSNLKKLHPNEVEDRDSDKDGFTEVYTKVEESDVQLCDPIPQKQLAEEIGKSGLMVLPTDYPEICSNIILQSLASGTPIVTTGNIGSSNEWINNNKNGVLTRWMPVDYMAYHLDVIRHSVHLLEDEKLHRKMIKNAAATKINSWDEIGHLWLKMLKKLN